MDNQAPQEKTKKAVWKRWWFWVGLIVLYMIGNSALNKSNDRLASNTKSVSNQEQAQQATQTVEPQKPSAITVTAETLMREYQANEVAADNKYKKQLVEVSGIVDSIGKDILDTPYVAFKTGESFFSVQCMFDPSQSGQLATLTKGQQLTLQGRVSGKLGNILIKECSF